MLMCLLSRRQRVKLDPGIYVRHTVVSHSVYSRQWHEQSLAALLRQVLCGVHQWSRTVAIVSGYVHDLHVYLACVSLWTITKITWAWIWIIFLVENVLDKDQVIWSTSATARGRDRAKVEPSCMRFFGLERQTVHDRPNTSLHEKGLLSVDRRLRSPLNWELLRRYAFFRVLCG